MRQFRYGLIDSHQVQGDGRAPAGALLAGANDLTILAGAVDAELGRFLVRLDPLVAGWTEDDTDSPVVTLDGYLPLSPWPEDGGGACRCCGWHEVHHEDCWLGQQDSEEPLAPLNEGGAVYCLGCGTLWDLPPWVESAAAVLDGPCPSCGRSTLTEDIPDPGSLLNTVLTACDNSATSPADWRQTYVDVWGDHLFTEAK